MRIETLIGLLPRIFSTTIQLDRMQRENDARRLAAYQQRIMSIAGPSGNLGDGRTANVSDAEAAGLCDPRGLFLGALDGRMLWFDGDGQLLSYARSGSGKGRDWILPNLAHVRDRSLVVVDVKDGENCFASYEHRDLTPNLHPVAIRVSASLLPTWAGEARGCVA